MVRRRKGRRVNGVLLVDKPTGVSSNYVVQKVKRLYQAQKAGHTGALDPLATGLLPICLGEATKFSQFLLESDKQYFVTARLGERTDTSDADGEIIETKTVDVSEQNIKDAIRPFIGNIKQVPSMYSALKHEGRPLYWYARKGINIERQSRDICIHSIEFLERKGDFISMNVACSKGTYIRSLVDDLGQVLACGAHVTVLRRTAVGTFSSDEMFDLAALEELEFDELDSYLLPMDQTILSLDSIELNQEQSDYFQKGGIIDIRLESTKQYRIYNGTSQQFLGVGEYIAKPSEGLKAKRVVVYE